MNETTIKGALPVSLVNALLNSLKDNVGKYLSGVEWDGPLGLNLHFESRPAVPSFVMSDAAAKLVTVSRTWNNNFYIDVPRCDEHADRTEWEASAYRALRDATEYDTLPVMVVIAGEQGAVERLELDAFMAAHLGQFVPEVD